MEPRRIICVILNGCSADRRVSSSPETPCAFNPIYGQGMTVSALDAITLKRCLHEQQRSPRADFEQHFQQQLAEITPHVWFLATNQDMRWPRVRLRGARPNPDLRLLHRYLDMVLSNAIVDPKLANAYFNVLILATPPSSLVPAAHGRTCPGSSTQANR